MCCPEPRAPGRTRCAKHIAEKNAAIQARYSNNGPDTWTTRSGARIPITQMSDGHLANSIAMLARKLTVLATEAARRARDATMLDEVLEPSPSDWERE
jgi:hypothetical protein